MSQQRLGQRAADAPGRLQKRYGYEVTDDDGVVTMVPDKGRTKQEFAKDADINSIVSTLTSATTGEWLENHDEWVKTAVDVEVPNIDYRELMTTVAESAARFAELPSVVRRGFDNDPAVFLDFIQSEGGDVELAELIAAANPVKKAGSVSKGAEEAQPEIKEIAAGAKDSPSSGEGAPG